MKTMLFVLFLTILLNSCSSSSSQRGAHYYEPASWSENGEMIESRVVKTYIVSKNNMKIKGLCFIETGPEREPCEDITILLIDHEKKNELETVTDEIGSFSFTTNDRSLKSIGVMSQRYKLKAGKVVAQAGSLLTIILVKK